MLCKPCQRTVSGLSHECQAQARRSPLAESFGTLLCARCGGTLPPVDLEDSLLAKLSQLSRFGLGGDDRRVFVDSPWWKV